MPVFVPCVPRISSLRNILNDDDTDVRGQKNSQQEPIRNQSRPADNNPPIVMEPSKQDVYMAITTQQGDRVQIPVDTRVSSKLARKNRKRNAVASAQCRARRKEKEIKASASVSRLEKQLREALEDIQYYSSERNYFRSIASTCIETRPTSPRLRRPFDDDPIEPDATLVIPNLLNPTIKTPRLGQNGRFTAGGNPWVYCS